MAGKFEKGAEGQKPPENHGDNLSFAKIMEGFKTGDVNMAFKTIENTVTELAKDFSQLPSKPAALAKLFENAVTSKEFAQATAADSPDQLQDLSKRQMQNIIDHQTHIAAIAQRIADLEKQC